MFSMVCVKRSPLVVRAAQNVKVKPKLGENAKATQDNVKKQIFA